MEVKRWPWERILCYKCLKIALRRHTEYSLHKFHCKRILTLTQWPSLVRVREGVCEEANLKGFEIQVSRFESFAKGLWKLVSFEDSMMSVAYTSLNKISVEFIQPLGANQIVWDVGVVERENQKLLTDEPFKSILLIYK